MTPERKELTDEEIERLVNEAVGPKPRPRPKLVVSDGEVVGDPPSGASKYVRLNLVEAERQRAWAEQDRELARARRREIDPFNFGHWGPAED